MLITTTLRKAFERVFGPMPDPVDELASTALVLIADGIGGLDLCATGLHYMVPRAGLHHRVETIHWCHGFGHWYRDLTNHKNLRDQAASVARRVAQYQSGPVYLVGKSGGCGVVLGALEALPENSVDRAILLAPAVSRTYNLAPALHAVRREIVVFYSPLDMVLLGAGTTLLGTVDRVRARGAGMNGFLPPPSLDPDSRSLYTTKLRQIRWGWRMARTGYLGGHVGADSPWFLLQFVVPLLKPDNIANPHNQAAPTAGR